MRGHHLHHLGVEAPAQQEILQLLLLLRVQEELDNLNDIFSGESNGRDNCLSTLTQAPGFVTKPELSGTLNV